MNALIAKRPILYRSYQYQAGDILPTDDQGTVDAWLEAGSAEWVPVEDLLAPEAPKAKPATATPGLAGTAVGGEGAEDNLVGRVPNTPERSKAKCKASRSKKQ